MPDCLIAFIFGLVIGLVVAGVGANKLALKRMIWLETRNGDLQRLLEATKRDFGEEDCIELEARLKKAEEISSTMFDTIERGKSALNEVAVALGSVSYEKKKESTHEK